MDVTKQAGVERESYGMGGAVGDYDNDGDLDLYVTNFGSNVAIAIGNGTFAKASRGKREWMTSAELERSLPGLRSRRRSRPVCGELHRLYHQGKPQMLRGNRGARLLYPSIYRPVPSRLFRNEGAGKFADVTGTAGIGNAFGPD